MNAAETIAAAIEKLEQMRAPGTWQGAGPWQIDGQSDVVTEHRILVADAWDHEIACVIVTLHRTIDAQLAILADAARAWADPMPMPMFGDRDMREGIYAYHLDLARAILGEVPA